MSDPIDFEKANADPPDLTPDPPKLPRRPQPPIPARDVSDQLFAAIRAFELRDSFSAGERELQNSVNDEKFEVIGSLAKPLSEEELNVEVDQSNRDRDELGITRENEALFRRFRSPDLSKNLGIQYLVAMGLEDEFAETLRTL